MTGSAPIERTLMNSHGTGAIPGSRPTIKLSSRRGAGSYEPRKALMPRRSAAAAGSALCGLSGKPEC